MRRIINILLAVSAACLILTAAGCTPDKPADTGPKAARKRVIVVTLDTTRADHFGFYGNKTIKTPNMDALAEDSVVFDNAYSTTHTTVPSHTSILTSWYMKDHKVLNHGWRVPDFPYFLPKLFKAEGYATAAIVSGGHLDETSNINQGFDHFDTPFRTERDAAATNREALDWLDKNADTDFFLWLHYFDPHMLYNPPEHYGSMYAETDPRGYVGQNDFNRDYLKKNYENYLSMSDDPGFYRSLYKGEISYMDSELGRLFGRLKELGIYNDTTIVVVADHGESLGEDGQFFVHTPMNEATLHVPFLVKPAGEYVAGHRGHIVSSLDIYPTLLDIARIQPPEKMRGVSLASVLSDPGTEEPHPEGVYFESVERIFAGIRTKDHIFIERLFRKDKKGRIVPAGRRLGARLYESTPGGWKDAVQLGETQQTVQELSGVVENFARDSFQSFAPEEITDKEHIEKLKALGYIQ